LLEASVEADCGASESFIGFTAGKSIPTKELAGLGQRSLPSQLVTLR
jgi:hypothetical protein